MWPLEAKRLADDLVTHNDPLTVAQMIIARVSERNRLYLVRKALYGGASNRQPSALMSVLADLTADQRVMAVLTYNYDDLLERALRNRYVQVVPIWEPSTMPANGDVPIFYPHGYLKEAGGPLVPIVLAEEDYHAYATDGYGWRNLVQLRQFSTSSCLFIGCSLTDPQVRRLLWVAKKGGADNHYAFLPTYSCDSENQAMIDTLVDSQLNEFGVRVIRYPVSSQTSNPHSRLVSLVTELIAASVDLELLWQ